VVVQEHGSATSTPGQTDDPAAHTDKLRPADRRRARPTARLRARPVVLGSLGVVLTIGIWEFVSRFVPVPGDSVPPTFDVAREFWHQLQLSTFWQAVWLTLQGWGIGLLITIVIAVPFGLLVGASRVIWRALRPTVEFLRSVPGVAFIPVAILLFGQETQSTVFLVVFGAFWPLALQAMYGVREIDDVARQTARVLRLTLWQRIRHLIVPSMLPFVATGVRIASAIALIAAITCGLVLGNPGLGRSIAFAEAGAQINQMYALIITSGVLGILMNVGLTYLERKAIFWVPQGRHQITESHK